MSDIYGTVGTDAKSKLRMSILMLNSSIMSSSDSKSSRMFSSRPMSLTNPRDAQQLRHEICDGLRGCDRTSWSMCVSTVFGTGYLG
jgi:hypothetical protein